MIAEGIAEGSQEGIAEGSQEGIAEGSQGSTGSHPLDVHKSWMPCRSAEGSVPWGGRGLQVRTPRRSAAPRELGLLISTSFQPHRDWIGISGSRGLGCGQDGSGSRDWIGIGSRGLGPYVNLSRHRGLGWDHGSGSGSGSRLGSRWIGISNLMSTFQDWIGISGSRTSRRSAANRTPRDRLLLEGPPPQSAGRGSVKGAAHS